jgi:hypothetical protein
MTSSSFQTENLDEACQCWYSDGREGGYALLDVLGHARHQVLAVLVQALGLFLVLVGGVDNGNMETALSASLGVLMQKSILDHGVCGNRVAGMSYSHVWEVGSIGGELLLAQGRDGKGASRRGDIARGETQRASGGLS